MSQESDEHSRSDEDIAAGIVIVINKFPNLDSGKMPQKIPEQRERKFSSKTVSKSMVPKSTKNRNDPIEFGKQKLPIHNPHTSPATLKLQIVEKTTVQEPIDARPHIHHLSDLDSELDSDHSYGSGSENSDSSNKQISPFSAVLNTMANLLPCEPRQEVMVLPCGHVYMAGSSQQSKLPRKSKRRKKTRASRFSRKKKKRRARRGRQRKRGFRNLNSGLRSLSRKKQSQNQQDPIIEPLFQSKIQSGPQGFGTGFKEQPTEHKKIQLNPPVPSTKDFQPYPVEKDKSEIYGYEIFNPSCKCENPPKKGGTGD